MTLNSSKANKLSTVEIYCKQQIVSIHNIGQNFCFNACLDLIDIRLSDTLIITHYS